MPVQVIVDGQPVTLDTRMWSFDSTVRPIAPGAFIGADLCDPLEVYRTQRSVRTVTEFLARNIAQIALHAFTTKDNGDRTRLTKGTLPRLLKSPSSTSTPFEFMHSLVLDVCLFDRFAALIVDAESGPQLVRLPPDTWVFERDGSRRPTKIIRVNSAGTKVTIGLSEVLWLDGYPVGGSSPLEALTDMLAEERESSKYRRELWEGGARMPGWIERPVDAPPWSVPTVAGGESARDKFRTAWQTYASGGLKVGRTPLLEDGMKYHAEPGGITPESAQQLEARKFSIAETAAYFHVPPVFVGLLDNANYSNVTAYREILYSDTLGTWLQQIQQAFNARLLTHPVMANSDEAFVEFNVAEKLRMSFDEQARIFQMATGAPILARSEARQRLNLPYIPGTEQLILPLNLAVAGENVNVSSDKEAAR